MIVKKIKIIILYIFILSAFATIIGLLNNTSLSLLIIGFIGGIFGLLLGLWSIWMVHHRVLETLF